MKRPFTPDVHMLYNTDNMNIVLVLKQFSSIFRFLYF